MFWQPGLADGNKQRLLQSLGCTFRLDSEMISLGASHSLAGLGQWARADWPTPRAGWVSRTQNS